MNSELRNKLEVFIRRYYRNRLMRGVIYSVGLITLFYVVAVVSEYLGDFSTVIRGAIFYGYMAVALVVVWFYIVVSLFKLYGLGKRINYYQASKIISQHFPDVKDKLINVLQLQELEDKEASDFVDAAINQKIIELRPIPFGGAVNYKLNLRYLKYAVIPLAAVAALYLFVPDIISHPTERLINYSTYYEPERDFYVKLKSGDRKVVYGDDHEIVIEVEGKKLPNELYLFFGGNEYKMKKNSKLQFSYILKNVRKDLEFYIGNGLERSADYKLTVLPKPIMYGFRCEIVSPAYTGIKTETLDNIGDLKIAEGSTVTWSVNVDNVDNFRAMFGDNFVYADSVAKKQFKFKRTLKQNVDYELLISNYVSTICDTLRYVVDVIPDAFPMIDIKQYADSIFDNRLYFNGFIKDDYGFTTLNFVANKAQGDSNINIENQELEINKNVTSQQFNFYIDLEELNIKKGDAIEYYFEVWDNDGVNGAKSSKSIVMNYKFATDEEILQQQRDMREGVMSDIEDAMKSAKDMIKQLKDIKKEMIDKPTLGWEEKQKLQEVINAHDKLEMQMENIKNKNNEKQMKEEAYNEMDQALIEKQKELQRLFDEVLGEDMKKMMDDLQKMMDKIDKNELSKKLEDIKMSSEDMMKQLDRELALFKNLEFEKKLNTLSDRLESLNDKQKSLKEEMSSAKGKELEELKTKQDELNKEFELVKDELKDLNQLNTEIEDSHNLDDINQLADDIEKDMEGASEKMENKDKKGASEKQDSASGKMEEMSQKLAGIKSKISEGNAEEDINSLRMILENLLTLSFDNEELMNSITQINLEGPKFVGILEGQNRIKTDFKIVEDSLFSLARRQMMIKNTIFKEVANVRQSMSRTIEIMSDRRIMSEIQRNMQTTLMSMNNLALLISEVIDAMNQEQDGKGNGEGQCNSKQKKPGGSQKKNMTSMRQMQQQLNKQMEGLQKMMQDGQGQDGKGMNKELAKLAAQQEALRRELQKMAGELKNEGVDGGDLQNAIRQMEQTETDLVNKVLNRQTINRQKDIETRLLKSEKAQLEREKEEKRESKDARGVANKALGEDIKSKNANDRGAFEVIKSMPPSLNQYYKEKVNNYFMNLKD